ncbi:hypothetical protein [Ciceribacter thiooxidans]|uniref:Uncharacterized protein n=1 Tax=Ciceribacter thiooxidans TaxID=1969821 RepID=A0ABV7I6M2_9HYPH|nr:hypothetical protein [Ciceribacter thiooxidans]MDI6836833.1 hypothetical protein [Rhizobiaceae bacterium]
MKNRSANSMMKLKPARLTRERAEKINAVEGLALTPRMKRILDAAAGKTADEQRALVRAQFAKESA